MGNWNITSAEMSVASGWNDDVVVDGGVVLFLLQGKTLGELGNKEERPKMGGVTLGKVRNVHKRYID